MKPEPTIKCQCGGTALIYQTGMLKKGKLWDVYRCMGKCGADIHVNPRDPPIGDSSFGTLFG